MNASPEAAWAAICEVTAAVLHSSPVPVTAPLIAPEDAA